MIIPFLSGNTVANQIGIPTVTTNQMTDKVNGITSQIYTFFSGIFNNIAIVCLIIAIIGLALSAILFKRGMKAAGASIIAILGALILFMNVPAIVGWVTTIAK